MKARILALMASFFLGACAGTPLTQERGPQEIGNNGLVVLSVTQGKEKRALGVFYLKQTHKHLMRQLTPYLGELFGKRDFTNPDGALWVLELEPGTHQIDGWGVRYNTGLGEGVFQPRGCPPLTFQVRSGEVIYLGNLHMETFMVRNIFGLKVLGKGYPMFRNERVRDVAKFQEKYPKFSNRPVQTRLLDFSEWRKFQELESEQ